MTTFTSVGTHTYDVPDGAAYIIFDVQGAGGGGGDFEDPDGFSCESTSGGSGGRITGKINTSDLPSTLEVTVGGAGGDAAGIFGPEPGAPGSNGGGEGGFESTDNETYEAAGGGGGGASDIRPEGGSFSNAIAVAGGGGGGAGVVNAMGFAGAVISPGGAGNYPNGNTTDSSSEFDPGYGGDQSAGPDLSGGDGAQDVEFDTDDDVAAGGGGGGGWDGGGGGGAACVGNGSGAAGGGGGASYANADTYDVTGGSDGQTSDGEVTITAVVPTVSNATTTYVGATEVELTWDSSDMDTFDVERDGVQIASGISGPPYVDTGISENTSHTWTIYGNVGGDRSDSDSTTAPTGGPPETFTVSLSDTAATVTASEPNAEYDELVLYRWKPSTDDEPTEIDRVTDASGYEYTDPGLLDGREYQYETETVYPRDTSSRETTTAKTALPAPTDLIVDDERDEEADASWTANHDNGETRIDVREDDEGEWADNTSVPYDTESATATGLLNGQLYGIRVVAQTPDAETEDE